MLRLRTNEVLSQSTSVWKRSFGLVVTGTAFRSSPLPSRLPQKLLDIAIYRRPSYSRPSFRNAVTHRDVPLPSWARQQAFSTMWWRSSLLGSSRIASIFVVWHLWTAKDDKIRVAHCEDLAIRGNGTIPVSPSRHGSIRMKDLDDHDETILSQVKRAFRMIRRLFKLLLVLSPVVALYPSHWMICQWLQLKSRIEERHDGPLDTQDVVLNSLDHGGIPDGPLGWYYKVCLFCVEWSGAACIKIMQWAGSRPDMFGQDFCAVFSQLQDDTTPHAWRHTEQALIDAFGTNWEERIRLDQILGSGCIAQVYKGAVLGQDGTERPVAVKVMHPNVEDDIDADLDLMRLSAWVLERLNYGPIRNLKWLNLPGIIEEMAKMLKIQLDLRTEGEHLVQFNKNFEGNQMILFPKLIEGFSPTQRVLVETYCEGVPVMDFIRNNKADRSLLSKMCESAIKAVCQMIFLDNFMHGDLHPGNVMVSNDCKFILLDVGIVTKHSESDHRLISDILAAFIRMDGSRAGRLMIDDSNIRLRAVGDCAVDEDKFIEKIEWLTVKASGKDYLMEMLGTYITYICNAAATHHVMLNQAFVSAALAVKVEEGIALALDPSIEIWRIAIPIILEGERRHGRVVERAKEIFGLERFVEWIKGSKTKEEKAIEERKKRAIERG